MTKKIRSSFSADFKMQAATLVLDQYYSVSQACPAMAVGETSLHHWVNRSVKDLGPGGSVKRLEMEKEILKKPPIS